MYIESFIYLYLYAYRICIYARVVCFCRYRYYIQFGRRLEFRMRNWSHFHYQIADPLTTCLHICTSSPPSPAPSPPPYPTHSTPTSPEASVQDDYYSSMIPPSMVLVVPDNDITFYSLRNLEAKFKVHFHSSKLVSLLSNIFSFKPIMLNQYIISMLT